MGMAKFSPMLLPPPPGTCAPAELTPTWRPEQSVSGPPLLPGLMAASVCTALTSVLGWLPCPTSTYRLRALTTPAVIVPLSPNGEPAATTGWPAGRPSRHITHRG